MSHHLLVFPKLAALALWLVILGSWTPTTTAEPFDLLIRNAQVVDGTGNPWFHADVAIRRKRIVAIGAQLAGNSKQTIIMLIFDLLVMKVYRTIKTLTIMLP